VAVAGPYLRFDAGKLGETALLQFSALVSAMGWINDMMLAKGSQVGEAGIGCAIL
jgi:hypothetical protein